MPNQDDVELNVGLKIGNIDFSGLSSSKLGKGVKQFTDVFQKALNKASKSTMSRSLGALFGKDTTSDLVKGIKESEQTLKDLTTEYKNLSKEAKNADTAMSSAMLRGAENVKNYIEALKKLEQEEANLAGDKKHAQTMYASHKGAAARSKDPATKAMHERQADMWKSEIDRISKAMSPAAVADRNKAKDFYKTMIANGGVIPQDMAKLQGKKNFATAGMASTKEAIADESKDLKMKQRQLGIIKKFQSVGSIVSSVFGGKKDDEPDKAPKKFAKAGSSSFSKTGKGLKKLGKNVMMFGLGFRSLYYLVKSLRKLVINDLAIMASKFDEVNGPLSDLLTAINQLKGAVGTMIQPIIQAVLPALKQLVQYLSEAAEKVGTFFAVLTGQDYIYKAKANQKDFAASILGTNKVADYDELKVIGDSNDIDYEKVAVSAESMSAVGQKFLGIFQTIGGILEKIFAKVAPFVEQILPPILDIVIGLLPVLETIFNDVLLPALDYIAPILQLLAKYVQQAAPVLTSLLKGIMPIITKLIEKLLPILERILVALQPVFDVLINTVLPFILRLLDAIMPLVEGILDCVIDILEPIIQLIAPLLELVITILDPILTLLEPILSLLGFLFSMLGEILNPVLQLITPLLQILTDILKPIVEILNFLIELILAPLTDAIKFIIGIIQGLMSGALKLLVGAMNTVADVFRKVQTVITNVWTKIRNVFESVWGKIKNVLNTMLGGIQKMVNGVIKGFNWMIDALNRLSFDVPDWVPIIGGKHFGFNISHIQELNIPKLAQGAVIPPNQEFLASLGDQRHGTNIEAPLDTIKQALIEAMQESGGLNKPVVLQVDGKVLAKVVWSEEEKRYKQTGKTAYAY